MFKGYIIGLKREREEERKREKREREKETKRQREKGRKRKINSEMQVVKNLMILGIQIRLMGFMLFNLIGYHQLCFYQ
jgi:hypothetical protein